MESAVYGGTLGVLGATAAGVPAALSDGASAGLILGGGALGCGLLVIGLTALAVRRGSRAEQDAAAVRKVAAGAVGQRGGRPIRGGGGHGAPDEPDGHAGRAPRDPYPPQPYSAREPRTHRPYSRPYQVPRQEQHGGTNGHRPPGSAATGIPGTPYQPPDEED